MKVKAQVIKELFNNEDYYILSLRPVERVKMELSSYGNFTLKGELNFLTVGETYDLDIELVEVNRYGATYELKTLPDLGLENLTDESEYKLLCEITSPKQSEYVNSAYPNFIRLVLAGEEDKIDVNKIYNVKEVRKNFLVREINKKLKFYVIKQKFSAFKFSLKECKKLNELYKSLEDIEKELVEKPYYVLIEKLGRGFESVDKTLIEVYPELKESSQRTEHLILHVLKKNQEDCNTRMSAREMSYYAKDIAVECLKNMKQVAIDSDLIYYEESTNLISRQDIYSAESEIAFEIKERLKDNIVLDLPYENYKKIKDGELTEEQSLFLKQCLESNITILTASSGCGKSSSVMALLNMLDDYKQSYTQVCLSGKAAKRLAQQTFRPASTIHRAIGFGGEPRDITTDWLIVDECSMIGIDLFQALLRQTPKGTRIVIIGDISQIPSIVCGNVLKDMINSEIVPVVRLNYCFRFKEGGLSKVATLMREGEYYLEGDTNERIVLGKNKDYEFVPCDNSIEQVLDEYQSLLDKKIKPSDICVITPCNVKQMGTVAINSAIQSVVNPCRPNEITHERKWQNTTIKFRPRDLVLVTKNNYNTLTLEGYEMLKSNSDRDEEDKDVPKVAVFNGEIGKVLSTDEKAVIVQIDENIVVFTKPDLDNLMLGYSLNTFKMQGSECPYVINITSELHKFMLNRNLAYTASTRARKKVIEIGDVKTISGLLEKSASDDRNTWLKDLLIKG